MNFKNKWYLTKTLISHNCSDASTVDPSWGHGPSRGFLGKEDYCHQCGCPVPTMLLQTFKNIIECETKIV